MTSMCWKRHGVAPGHVKLLVVATRAGRHGRLAGYATHSPSRAMTLGRRGFGAALGALSNKEATEPDLSVSSGAGPSLFARALACAARCTL